MMKGHKAMTTRTKKRPSRSSSRAKDDDRPEGEASRKRESKAEKDFRSSFPNEAGYDEQQVDQIGGYYGAWPATEFPPSEDGGPTEPPETVATTIDSPTDGETVDPLAPIVGTTAPDAEAQLFLDGNVQATTVSDSEGAYSFDGDSPMTGGEGSEHTVQVKAEGASDSPTITITLSA
jgi:hypothetical protein